VGGLQTRALSLLQYCPLDLCLFKASFIDRT